MGCSITSTAGGATPNQDQRRWAPWAKLGGGEPEPPAHPLLCHLIDVAAVSEVLWDSIVGPGMGPRLAAALGLDMGAARVWVACLAGLAGLHDLGKASPDFQYWKPRAPAAQAAMHARLRRAGLAPPPRRSLNPPAHGTVTASVLPPLLVDRFGVDQAVATGLATAVGGHHGVFPRALDVQHVGPAVGGGAWHALRADLTQFLANLLGVQAGSGPTRLDNATAIWLAGFVSVADWLGSDAEHFPFKGDDPDELARFPVEAYAATARGQARRALARRGWQGWPVSGGPRAFSELFGGLLPNAMQRAAVAVGERVSGPTLVVIEAPMGEGKTEAALALVDRWGAGAGRSGCYVALPTQATSDQMFGRVRAFLERRYPADLVNLHLLHGHAALSAEFASLPHGVEPLFEPTDLYGDLGFDQVRAGVVAAEWFTHRKRGLLAPFGVGTVDQALLAVLQTRHGFVRLFGLAGKTVVIDEVHAYDAYMSTLLERLLAWLAALGSSVVLLSATLPLARRDRLLAAYAGGLDRPPPSLPPVAYPRLAYVDATTAAVEPLTASARGTKQVRLEWVDGRLPAAPGDPFPLGERLRDALAGGGCAAVVCNTVGRAQALYRELLPFFPGDADDGGPVLDLLHARFLYEDRQARERRALRRFGKEGETVDGTPVRRPNRALLVATQVIEQSLDLDFDLLVTDHAPVDLILQRLGRLHRHERPDRPVRLREPALWMCRPEREEDDVPTFDPGTAAVYDPHILLRSWLVLHDRAQIRVPTDIGDWIEHVYDDANAQLIVGAGEALQTAWETTKLGLAADRAKAESAARRNRVLPPHYADDILQDYNQRLEEDDPTLHPDLQALTRLGEPTTPVVCLPEAEADLLRRSERPSIDAAKRLLRRSVSLPGRWLARAAAAELASPSGWKRSPLLRHHRLLPLDAAGGGTVGPYRVVVDPALGVRVERRNGPERG